MRRAAVRRRSPYATGLLMMGLLAAGCAADLRDDDADLRPRAVAVEGVACARQLDGDGVVVGDGLVVTNAHVVAGARRVRVLIPQRSDNASILGTRAAARGAQVVGLDLETDLAVLKTEGGDLPFLALGGLDQLATTFW